MPTVTITHADGSTETIPTTISWSHEREIGKMRKLKVTVDRDQARAVTLEQKSDAVELSGVTEGRLVNVEKSGPTWTLVVYSYEWDAKQVEPTAGGTTTTGTDDAIITDLVNDVGAWSVGSIASFTNQMTFVFNHAFRHEALRRVERNVPGELRWNDDASVDYVDSLGSDKTGSVTLSAANGNLDGEISIKDQGRDFDATHMRLIGAHEGEAQISATLVPGDDPETYANRVNYSTSRWSPGDTRTWDRWSNKDVADQGTIVEEAESIAEEIKTTHVEAKATVVGEDIERGDMVRVEKPEADLSRDMRVHRIVTRADGPKVVDDVLLSTRTVVRGDVTDRVRDIQRFNVAWEGASVAVNPGPFGKAVDLGDPFEFKFKYPELEYENSAKLQVTGLPYRIDSVGAGAGGDHFHEIPVSTTSENNSEFSNTTEESVFFGGIQWLNGSLSETVVDDITPSGSTSRIDAFVSFDLDSADASSTYDVWLENTSTGDLTPFDKTRYQLDPGESFSFHAFEATDVDGETLEINIEEVGDNTTSGTLQASVNWIAQGLHTHTIDSTETSDASGDHTHPPEPGIYTTSDTPSNVDVAINGTTVATDVGSGQFETVIDVGGEFDNDAWNTVEVSSDSLGIVEVSAFIEGYDQIGKGGN